MIDDDHLHGPLRRLEPQAELFLERTENRGSVGIGRCARASGGGGGSAGVISSGRKSSRTSKSPLNPVLSITGRPSTIESIRMNSGICTFPPCIRAAGGAAITPTLPHRASGA